MRRAQSVAQPDKIAVMATQPQGARVVEAAYLPPANCFVQPCQRGTAHEILLTLLHLESRVSRDTPVLFLPSDHVVGDENIFTRSLKEMITLIVEDSRPVYLLGAAPEGPHDRLGYIVPWYDAMHMAAAVYEFVEEPDIRHARKLIHAGGLWNTFIFGSSLGSLLELFPAKYDAALRSMRVALNASHAQQSSSELSRVYANLASQDFSQDILATRKDRLHVLRMPRCGWWPLIAPRETLPTSGAAF